MRFLMGLMLGAGAVLFLAAEPDAVAHWQARLAQAAGELQQRLRPAAGTAGSAAPAVAADHASADHAPADHASADHAPADHASADHASAGWASAAPARTAAGSAGHAPAPTDADAVPAEAPPVALPPIPSPPMLPQPAAPAELLAGAARRERAVGLPLERAAATPPSVRTPASPQQPVWVPFHSEMSASGFAERLSAALRHPFQVERQGPGRYQVVFAYRDEPQRQALLDEAARVTGLPL